MFCYQRNFGSPTEVVTLQDFNKLVDSAQTRWLTLEHRRIREALPSMLQGDTEQLQQWAHDAEFQKFCASQEANSMKGAGGKTKGETFRALTMEKKLQAYCDSLKKSLPFVIFIATYAETVSTGGKMGSWRKQAACRLNGLCVIDFDHIDADVRKVWEEAYARLTDEDKARVLLVYVTPSGHGLKVIFKADVAYNLIDNQKVFAEHLGGKEVGLNPDEVCRDASRGAFLTTREDILLINDEVFTYENKEFGDRYNSQYHAGHSQPALDFAPSCDARTAEPLTYNDVPLTAIIEAWMEGRNLENHRHDTLVELASHLRYLVGRNVKKITEVVMSLPWVHDLSAEGEDVAGTVSSVMGWRYTEKKPQKLVDALRKSGALKQGTGTSVTSQAIQSPGESSDIYASLPLDKWAADLQEMAAYYPCLKQLFLNVHPHKLPAVLFSSAALFGTLMTRTWYHFWYDPEIERRLNYCIFIIGDPGAGKNVIEKFYFKIADPMIQADQVGIDAVNRYKDGRTERTTSTKAQKDDALKKPIVGIRVHPARTATGEFIRHMMAAVETVQGRPMNLHMFSFDSELDNVTKQNKGGDWKDREIMELKSFHNEQDGQMYANQESITGMFNVFWNFIYTGTPYALHRKVNQRNFGTGISTRLAVIPLPDVGLAQRHQQVDSCANETLKTWAYRLDKVEGEIPVEPLNDETYEWQSAHLEIAEFNDDKADRMLLKRIPYYGIGISLPFIMMRHWDEWQESRCLTMDDRDRRLCRLAMEIQYKCQQFFFGEMAFNYFADQGKEFVVRKRSNRYDECFRKLPDEFKRGADSLESVFT